MNDHKEADIRPLIVGLGYVGLPLLLKSALVGLPIIGFDKDERKLASLRKHESYIKHIPSSSITAALNEAEVTFSSDPQIIQQATHIIVCLPTPLGHHREPDLSFVLDNARELAPYLKKGQTYILESTTYPGTTEVDLRKVLEEGSGLTAGVDFHLAYSPEREDPGNPLSDVALIPKLLGGLTGPCRDKAAEFYSKFVQNLIPVSSCAIAESAKLFENVFRAVNIGLVNELKVILDDMKIDVWEVIQAAKTKPFGFMAFYPGPGLGGHCIPIDPFYLSWKARGFGHSTRFIDLAGEVNMSMPAYVTTKVGDALNSNKKSINGSKILVVGVAYKANVDDDRESATYQVMDLLHGKGAEVCYHDPFVPVVPANREHPCWVGHKSVPWDAESLSQFDAVLISTAHDEIDYALALDKVPVIIDTRNIYQSRNLSSTEKTVIWKA